MVTKINKILLSDKKKKEIGKFCFFTFKSRKTHLNFSYAIFALKKNYDSPLCMMIHPPEGCTSS